MSTVMDKKDVEDLIKLLEEKCYKEITPPPFIKHNVLRMFQKRFDDDKGKKYFIDVIICDEIINHTTGESFGYPVEYETQLTYGEEETPMNLGLFAGWEIADVEKKVEEIFTLTSANHYELWD